MKIFFEGPVLLEINFLFRKIKHDLKSAKNFASKRTISLGSAKLQTVKITIGIREVCDSVFQFILTQVKSVYSPDFSGNFSTKAPANNTAYSFFRNDNA